MFLCSRPGTTLGSFHVGSALSSACGGNVFTLDASLHGRHPRNDGLSMVCRLLSTGKGIVTARRGATCIPRNRFHAIGFAQALPSVHA